MASSYNTYDKISSLEWNGVFFVLTVRNELTNTFTHAYSPDGINWKKDTLPSNIATQNPYISKWVGDKYFVGGNLVSTSLDINGSPIYTNCLATIKDMSNVNIVPIPAGDILYDIEKNLEYRNTIVFPKSAILAVGGTSLDSAKIAYSFDQGVTWSPSSSSASVFTSTVYDAVWNGRIWVAAGSGGNTLATSLDGTVWTGRGSYALTTQSNAVDWSDQLGRFVAVGSGTNSIVSSQDGIHWLASSNALSSGNDVKWNGTMWVAVGTGTQSIVYSYDGLHWSSPTQTDLFDTAGKGVSWNGSIWVAIGSDTGGKNIATSADGIHWTMISETALLYPLQHVYSDAEYTIICASDNVENSQIYVIAGNDFASHTIHTGVVSVGKTVAHDGVKYLIGGGVSVSESADLTHYNDNGFSSFSSVQNLVTNNATKGSATIQPLTIACGEGNTSLAYSLDGIQWCSINNTLFSRANHAVWNGRIWVAVGTGNYWVATSYDGIKWVGQESTLMTEGYDVAWNGLAFVAVGTGANSIVWSVDGFHWTPVSNPPFSTRASAIVWTGEAWVAYGSGTNTTAISHSMYGDVWSPTTSPNLAITNGSSALSLGYTVAASSTESPYIPEHAFDGSFNTNITVWNSSHNSANHAYSGGAYNGIVSTTYDTSYNATGEWIQVELESSATIKYYYMVFQVSDASAIPYSWILLGSNDANTWHSLDTFTYETPSYPNNDWKYPFVALPLNVYANTTPYLYYRIVFTRSFGASYISVAGIDFFAEAVSSNSLDIHEKPIVLRDAVLHPTRLLSVGGSNLNIYQMTDLSGALIRNGYIHGSFVNNVVYGTGSGQITGSSFDGFNHLITSTSGITYLSNESAIGPLDFDTSYNAAPIEPTMSTVYSSCYNTHFSVLGGTGTNVLTYNTLREGVPPTWHATNANQLFTTVYGVASNSGYGMVVSPNAIYLNDGEKLSLVTPKSYNSYLQPETSITFNYKPAE